MTFGLVAFGTSLGTRTPVSDIVSEYTDEVDRVLGYGYENIHRAATGDGITDLAVRAGVEALTGSGIAAIDVDLLVLAVTDVTEYLYWDAAAAVAARLGATRAEAVLMTQACTSGIVCLDTVAGRFATHPNYTTALVIAANRTSEEYFNRLDTQPLLFSDGAAAAVARRGHTGLRWCATETLTDGRFVDFFRLDEGGSVRPFMPGLRTQPRVRGAWEVMEAFDYDADRFADFMRQLDVAAGAVLSAACARVGVAPEHVASVVFTHDTAQAYASLATELGMPGGRLNADLAAAYGHLGAADHLNDLAVLHAAGMLRPGTLVALLGRGRGMHWACTLLEV